MNKLLLLVCLLTISCSSKDSKYKKTNDSTNHIIYLVRHAEKADDGTSDPPLTNEGEKRAEKLATLLKNEKITKIYSTNFNRTKNTAFPLSDMLKIETEIYDPRDTAFYNKIRKEALTHNILIVGHSNTTPSLTNNIIGEKKYQDLDESVYNMLFSISVKSSRYESKTTTF